MNTETIKAEVESILKRAYKHRSEIKGAINWGDLHCVAVQEVILIDIEEAEPGAWELQQFVQQKLLELGYQNVEVRTSW